jgi:DNA-binding transcriptional MerR regulator
MRNPTQVS